MKRCILITSILLTVSTLLLFMQGCTNNSEIQANSTDGQLNGDRAPLEGLVSIRNPEAVHYQSSPTRYALVVEQEYELSFKCNKYMGIYDEYQMDMEVYIPPQIQVVQGPTTWTGTNTTVTLELIIKPIKTGVYDITGTFVRSDNHTDGMQRKITTCIGNTTKEAKQLVDSKNTNNEINISDD